MSGPYRFNGETAKSPLDRSSSPFSAGQPVSFKTNVNRAKTKKWVTAKKNAYDGDDWGDYDEYDEYGVDQEPPPAEPAPSQRYYAGGPPQRTYTDRSFTDPAQQGPPGKARRNSFEAGEEHRAFSASIPPPQHGYGQPQAMPPPLQTQMSPMPADVISSPSRTQFPPRKSSISQAESPMATSPRPRTGSHSDKPLPFVRPADIYKRVEEERERERSSMDSSRPSLDSLLSRPRDDPQSPTSDGGRMLQPLETVAERKSEYLPDFDPSFAQNGKQPAASGLQSQAPGSHAPVVPPPNDQGFRSFVDQAFVRTDDQRSIPPTPISKDDDSNMSRTNTGSTVGISPIMSRVPSGATSAVKRSQAGGDGSTPAIAEEPSDTATAIPQPVSYSIHDTPSTAAQRLPTDHSRNLSSSSLPRSGLATPTRGESPARSPVIAPQTDLPEPKAAHIATDSPDQPHNMDGGLSGPSPAYAVREADIASAAKSKLTDATPGLGAAEKQSQDAFLESHIAQSPIEDALPRSRSESPSKGRVQALASTFGDVSHSRRGSTQSNMSRNSVQSWEKSQDNSRAPSPTKGSPSKPSSPVKEFRPHLPGQWESYATTAPTPLDQSERDRSLGFDTGNTSGSLGAADLTPTTAKRPVEELAPDSSDPLAALKSAGAAMAQSIRTTVGMDDATSEPRSQQVESPTRPSHGDMYMPRPLQLERTISSISSIPPTPPAKDTPKNEHPPQLSSEDMSTNTPVQQKRPDFFPQLSTQPSADDEESDRLRKEIVASLTPVPSADPKRSSLQPASPGTNRASSILPAEYDSYWADGGVHASSGQSPDAEHSVPALASTAAVPSASPTNEPPKPFISRFSWENNTPQLAVPETMIGDATMPEPAKTSHEDTIPSPAVERAAEEERQQWSDGLPDPQTGANHTFTVTKPDPATEPDLAAQSPSPPVDHGSLASPTRERTRSPGLHVVNSAIDPEPVDLPPRLSGDVSAPTRNSQDDLKSLQEVPNPALSTSNPIPEPSSPEQAHHPEPTATSPTSGRPLDIREIATISSAAERIATYNHTRDHWATHDHGLEGWLVSALDANPNLATQINPAQRASTGTVRHKHAASLSILGKFGGSSMQVNEQQQATAVQAPVGSNSPTSGAQSGSNAAFDRRVASRQLEAKGKDLLHTANVLSGKGLTSAKGLFAKGKSRFGREKGPHSRIESLPSSREASEEPEFIATTTPDRPVTQFSTDTDSPREERKKRRFSITSFHRSSRSRSRPSSIVLPSNTSFFSSTPKGTPPRELSRTLGEEKSRPNSYHAPDSWNFAPGSYTALGEQMRSTPPRESPHGNQSRLGILPSPAKSAFSGHGEDTEVPPVPRIPDTMRLSNDLSHEVLQSVIRYSTPPPAKNSGPALPLEQVHQGGSVGQKVSQLGDVVGKSHPNRPGTLSAEPEDQRRDICSLTIHSTTASTAIDNDAPPQPGHGQWPLVDNVQPGASVSNSGKDELLAQSQVELPSSAVQEDIGPRQPRQISPEDFDEDDQPPQLSYDLIPPSSKLDELESLPAYLVLSHMDVSDDEDYDKNRFSLKANGKSLLPPPKLPLDEVTTLNHVQPTTPNENVKYDGLESKTVNPTKFPTVTHETAAMHPSDVTSNSPAQSNIRAMPTETDASSHDKIEMMDAGNVSIGSSPLQEGNGATSEDSRDPARSPAPAWFATSNLQLPKTRTRGAEDLSNAPEQQLLSDHDIVNAPEDLQAGTTTAQTARLSPHEFSADAPRRVSAAPFQVVHAVEEYAASDSSFASWDCNSVIAKSISGSSQPDDMRDESDLVTPVAQVPRIVQHGQADEAERSNGTSRMSVTPNNYFGGHEIPSHTMLHPQQSQDLTVPERSKSMLSMISSMVSEGGTPISPASSNAGRSTPSTIRRMQRDSPEKSALMSGQIPEESMTSNGDHTPTTKDDDFDLYADHNGIVKDVRDENGQPLRVAQSPEITQQTKQIVPATAATSEAHSGDRPRYSTERPMSFISGSTDQDGRPQDQLNQPLKQGNPATRAVTEQPPSQSRQAMPTSSEPNYSSTSSNQVAHRPDATGTQRPGPQFQRSAQAPIPSDDQFREANNTATSVPSQPSLIASEPTQPSTLTSPLQESQIRGASPGQPMPQRSALQGRTMMSDHDPRFPTQSSGPHSGPRNEYEFQQQMMRLQAQYPHPQGANGPGPRTGPQVPIQQTSKQQDKPSSLPKLSSVFKGLGGKFQSNSQQVAPLNPALRPDMQLSTTDPNRNASYHSAVSSLNQEQQPSRPREESVPFTPPTRPREQPVSFTPPHRPPSNGAESHFSRVSQTSTQVQPTDSRIDLRKPANPVPFQGIPPKVLPHGVTLQNGQPQQYRASTNGLPETGKKKRFSTLGNIFGRSGEGQPAKPKLSREEKKAQKAQRHSTAPPMQVTPSQWPPQSPQFRPQQSGMPYPPGQYPPHQIHPVGSHFTPSQTMSLGSIQSAQSIDPYGPSQHYQQAQPKLPMQQQTQGVPSEQSSAYLRTKQLAEQHQAQKALAPSTQTMGPTRSSTHALSTSFDQHAPQSHQTSYGPPPGGYYNPNPISPIPEQAAYKTTQAARLLAEQQRQQAPLVQGAYGASHSDQQQQQYQQLSIHDQEAHRALQAERLRFEQQRLRLEIEQRAHAVPTMERAQQHQEPPAPRNAAHGAPQPQRQQVAHTHTGRQQPVQVRQHIPPQNEANGASHDELLRAHHERQQLEQQLRSQQYADRVQPALNTRSASGPLPQYSANTQVPVSQRHVSSRVEPQYETPQIPAAYSHVSGAFVSPRDWEQQAHYGAPHEPMVPINQYERQYSDPRMPSLSPQVSAQSQMPPNNRTHSDASTVSVVSPITTPAQDVTSVPSPPVSRVQQPKMSSISEVHQGTPERPWHLNFPEGATEQEIVRARQRQFMQQQFTAQQQQHAERIAHSPSPRGSSHSQSPALPTAPASVSQQQGGGFKELLPRGSPQPYQQSQLLQTSNQMEHDRASGNMAPRGYSPTRLEPAAQPAAYPLPMAPESVNARSPVNPLADALSAPPASPKPPHSPMHSMMSNSQIASSPGRQHVVSTREQYEPSPPQEEHYLPPPPEEQSLPDEPPPSYDGPGVPNDGMDKSRPDQPRPPNIAINPNAQRDDPRPRQPSIGILQHPQPASMAASPQRSSADMGAESLRRQLLQQEEHARMERIQRAQIQRAESEREKQERDAARARARELERSVSGGDRVGGIHSVAGSRNGGQPGWQRRGSSTRQVFELPAVEDDEPAMRATSYPGQEWVPPVWTDD